MNRQVLPLGLAGANCYMLENETAALVIDPGAYSYEVKEFLEQNKEKQRIILITHAHFDHIGGAKRLADETGVKIAIGEDDAYVLSDCKANLSDMFRAHLQPFTADIILHDGEEYFLGNIKIKAIATPGHTVGGMCFFIDGALYSGDTLFCENIGRTDFPGGDFNILIKSIDKLYAQLDGATKVFPGHGQSTTIAHEKQYNPWSKHF